MDDDTERERESSRTGTAEFRIPAKVDLTRPDIAVRRPPKPKDEPADEPSEEPAAAPRGPWYVQFTPPAEAEAGPEAEPEFEAEPETEPEPEDDEDQNTRWDFAWSAGEEAAGDSEQASEQAPEQDPEPDSAGEAPEETDAQAEDVASSATVTMPWRPTPPPSPEADESPEADAPEQAAPPQDDPAPAAAPAEDSDDDLADGEGEPPEAPEPDPEAAGTGRHRDSAPQDRSDDVPDTHDEPPEIPAPLAGPRHAAPPQAPPEGPADVPATRPNPIPAAASRADSPEAAPPEQDSPADDTAASPQAGPRHPAPPQSTRPSGGTAGPTRVERLPVLPQQPGSWQAALPQAAPQTAPPQDTPPRDALTDAAPPQSAPPRSASPQSASPQAAPPQAAAPQAAPPQSAPPQAAPPQGEPSQGALLPAASVQEALPQEYPAARTSGQWSVPWDGPPLPVPPVAPVEEKKKKKRGRRWLVVLVVVLVLVGGGVAGQLLRPPPDPTVRLAIPASRTFQGQAPALSWPAAGQAVISVDGAGTMGSSGGAAPTPTASVAKVMTAYVYLRSHPLKSGEAGPVLTVSPQAAAQIPARKRRGESLLGVTANQRLTQRKALEALLIISANDVAHELARWDSGSDQAFVAKMNATAQELGMTSTRYTDPSGYDSRTVSTAADQVKLLRAAMQIPAFTEIVNNRMYVPDGGGAPRQGGNFILGRNGVVAGKTGYTDAAGGNFVFAAHKNLGGVTTLIVGAVMGQHSPNAAGAVNAAESLLVAAERALVAAPLARKGDVVGWVEDGLDGRTALRATAPVTVIGWPGLTVPVRFDGDPSADDELGDTPGVVDAGSAKVPVKLEAPKQEPSIVKRLTRLR
ncbi:hypothetical protein [Spirillospora sp. CA-128828]|uniref:D-alanyl-D-alanine carboxypeptidase family protein n=1 Tax=Spirillospora sp. CA-128828 TaxID=3240033 RepID=UPI003D92CAC4